MNVATRPIAEDLPAALRRAADAIERGRDVADSDLRAGLAGLGALDARRRGDARRQRRAILRWIWVAHFPGVARTPAAALIADAWQAWELTAGTSEAGAAPPGSLADLFQRLAGAGIRPCRRRIIVDDLDEALDAYR